MVKLIIVDKGCNLKVTSIKNLQLDTLYKKCNLKKKDNLDNRTSWEIKEGSYVTLFAKDEGRANSENKYELPPPIDKELYYGSMVLIKHTGKEITNDNVEDLSLEEWNKLYEKLFGGFEDLNEEDSYSEDDEIPEQFKTKDGYSKEDGFIVSEGEEGEEGEEDYISQEEDEAHSSTDDGDDAEEDVMGKDSDIEEEEEEEEEEEDDESDYESDVGSELSEESYVDSD
jgi:hypothetical protein